MDDLIKFAAVAFVGYLIWRSVAKRDHRGRRRLAVLQGGRTDQMIPTRDPSRDAFDGGMPELAVIAWPGAYDQC